MLNKNEADFPLQSFQVLRLSDWNPAAAVELSHKILLGHDGINIFGKCHNLFVLR